MLGLGGINGTIALAAAEGMFTIKNAPVNAVLFMAGPGAILTAALMEGEIRQRIIAALLAGIIATGIVMLAAGFGPELLNFLNLKILKIAGGLAIFAIALLIMGVKIPENIPTIIIIIGAVTALIWR